MADVRLHKLQQRIFGHKKRIPSIRKVADQFPLDHVTGNLLCLRT